MANTENISFNPKTTVAVISIVIFLVTIIAAFNSVQATTQQNSKAIDHHEEEIEAMRVQFSEMKNQLAVIQEQNKQLKGSVDEVKADVKELKNDRQ